MSLILRYTPFASLSCAYFTTCHCSLVLAAGCGGGQRYLRVMGRNDKLRRLPRQREAPPERWETAFRRFAKGAPWQIGVSLLKQRTSQKMTCDRCIVALHIGQIQIHDSAFRMIQKSSNLYNRRIVSRESWLGGTWPQCFLGAIGSFSIDP